MYNYIIIYIIYNYMYTDTTIMLGLEVNVMCLEVKILTI